MVQEVKKNSKKRALVTEELETVDFEVAEDLISKKAK